MPSWTSYQAGWCVIFSNRKLDRGVLAGGGTARRRKGGPAVWCVNFGPRTSADGGGRRREPALRPLRNSRQHRLERAPTRGESIAHTHRRSRVDKPFHEPF